jgi:PhnB protein
MAGTIEGGCLCGAIRFRVEGAPVSISICHCQSCRRAGGAPSVSWFVISRRQFTILSGSAVEYPSSARVKRGFCGRCGTQLIYEHDSAPDTIELTTASLDEPSEMQPTKEIWLSDKLPWAAVNQNSDHHWDEESPLPRFKPVGWSSVTPRIVAVDAKSLVEFVKQVFDATGEYRDQAPAEMKLGDSIIMISDAGVRAPTVACLYVYVANVDATWQRAIVAGAHSIEAPGNTPYGDRRGIALDRWGNTWQIATRLPK